MFASEKIFLVADTRLYTLPCRSVGRSVRRSVTFLNSDWFSHYCSCPTVRDWIAVYPALFFFFEKNQIPLDFVLFYHDVKVEIMLGCTFEDEDGRMDVDERMSKK